MLPISIQLTPVAAFWKEEETDREAELANIAGDGAMEAATQALYGMINRIEELTVLSKEAADRATEISAASNESC